MNKKLKDLHPNDGIYCTTLAIAHELEKADSRFDSTHWAVRFPVLYANGKSGPKSNGGYYRMSDFFPVPPDTLLAQGMTLRDYFAAKAMQAWIQAIAQNEGHRWTPKDFATEAYQNADAMLAARSQDKTTPQ